MKNKGLAFLFGCLLSISFTAAGSCQQTINQSLTAFANGDFQNARQHFTWVLGKKYTTDALSQVHRQLGRFKAKGHSRWLVINQQHYLLTSMLFSSGPKTAIGRCDPSGAISYFEWGPWSDARSRIAKAKVQKLSSGVSLVPDILRSRWGPLPAVWTFPQGNGPFAAVLLVAGAGAQDMDGREGANQPLKQLAIALAKKGIASFRYDKAIRAYPTPAILDKQLTVDDDETDDALSALSLMAKNRQLNPQRIFLLGHSLGAMLAPRIAKRSQVDLKGVIMMAAPSLTLLDNAKLQTAYLDKLNALNAVAAKQHQIELEQEQQLLANHKPGTAIDGDFIGMPQSWFLSLHQYAQVKVAQSLTLPLLLLQGAQDFQVPAAQNWPIWQAALNDKTNATLIEYPALSHLFMPAGKAPSPKDYQKAAVIPAKVTDDMNAWIKAHS
ncbi:alpha/beta hydrolase family protein [Gallaecimonas mangrovi]|uniref:alpha/beta hydrolase family protein n=1 Tax=Gallaecimonas mangrovi TaxID=2291597 RepID=UPI000E1FD68E|nr:alpha/beta hydrolase [Gallaecimonas mangrovi]